jgi:hypothetical protein
MWQTFRCQPQLVNRSGQLGKMESKLMSIATYLQPSVEVQLPAWIDALWGDLGSARLSSDDAIGRLYARMDAEYAQIDFGPGRKRSPLQEIDPV